MIFFKRKFLAITNISERTIFERDRYIWLFKLIIFHVFSISQLSSTWRRKDQVYKQFVIRMREFDIIELLHFEVARRETRSYRLSCLNSDDSRWLPCLRNDKTFGSFNFYAKVNIIETKFLTPLCLMNFFNLTVRNFLPLHQEILCDISLSTSPIFLKIICI